MKTKLVQILGPILVRAGIMATLGAATSIVRMEGADRADRSQNCGLLSLCEVAKVLRPSSPDSSWVVNISIPGRAISLSELAEIADRLNLGLVAVKRLSGGDLPVPSVAHCGERHYVGILERV